jgi:hypothetical protein
MTFIDRIRFTRDCFRQAWYEGLVEATLKALNLADDPAKRRLSVAGIAGLAFSVRALPADASNPCPAKNTAQSNLVGFFKNVGLLLYIIGGVLCLVCFAWAAILFMGSAGNGRRADKGMRMAKNTCWGLVFLAGGFFIRSIEAHYFSSVGQVVSGDSGSTGGTANSMLCDNLNNVSTTP